ncbi:class I SAM-dependent methyltransferase [Thermodesulfobacteriota bacterium]
MFEKSCKPVVENGLVVGNVYDKQTTQNPIAKWLVKNFDQCFLDLIAPLNPDNVLEVGCGEGRLTKLLLERTTASIRSMDVSDAVLQIATESLVSDRVRLENKSIYDLDERVEPGVDLVVCCEVLEHLQDPRQGLEKLQAVANPYCLLSVPSEPIWRILNMMRGAYWRELGNTPGHIQHWNRKEFIGMVSDFFHVEEVKEPLPWIMTLCRSKR